MSNNVDNILKLINKTIVDNYSINIWSPVLLTTDLQHLSFKPLNISQQKTLLSTAVIQDLYNTQFTLAAYDIIKENYLNNETLPLSCFSVLDKIIILLSLRANINTNYKENNISDIIKYIQTQDFSVFTSQVLESDNIKLYCGLPSIYTEYLCEKEREVLVTEDINEQIQDVVSETIVNELTKYSLSVSIDQENIDLSKFSFSERKAIISTLPAFLLEKALDYIVSCRKSIEKLLTIKVAEDKEELLQINGVFFSTI